MLYKTHAVVHLDHIAHNIQGIRARVGDKRKILLAVKANAYGHGSVAVSRMAESIGVEWLGVATVPEGVEIRKAGVALPILKFSPSFPEEMQVAVDNDLTLTVCEKENIATLNACSQALVRRTPVHLKIDSGMGRIGVAISEAAQLAAWLERECPALYLEGVFTHLPVSDDPSCDSFTANQLARFRAVVAEINKAIGREVSLVHAANSGGILAHEESWLSMVRPGIMLYGFRPDEATPATVDLKPGLSFLTAVSFLKRVNKGTPIGYGGSWIAPEDTWIATFPAGYADGFNRLFSNSGRVLIGGRSYPVVGRVCMDQSMCNLGTQTDVRVGDQVTLIGRDGAEEISVYEWARHLNTITYEVTCQINSRVARHHHPHPFV